MEIVTEPNDMKASDSFWFYLTELMSRYFRVDVKGINHLPKKGPGIIIPNHSGFAGADGIILSHVINKKTDRIPIILAHRTFFDWSSKVKAVVERFGLRRVSYRNGIQALKRQNILLLFPEGEAGNFKPSLQSYHLQPFHTGFIRMAIETKTPIIPCLVIGAEESHLNLGNIDLTKFVKDLHIPLPLNFIPLPAKWTIKFLKPIHLKGYTKKDIKNTELMKQLSTRIRRKMQVELGHAVKKRPYVYFPFSKWIDRMNKTSH